MSKFDDLFGNDTFFARFTSSLADILVIGLMWIICSIPIITISASTTAAYYVMVKCVRKNAGTVFKEFFHSFRLNFKQSLKGTFLFGIASAILIIDIVYLWINENKTNDSLFVVALFLFVLVLSVWFYYCPLLSRFEYRFIDYIKISAIFSFKYIYVNIGCLIFLLCLCFLVYIMPWLIFFAPGIYMFLCSFPIEWVIRKLMPKVEEDSEEAKKWYYS